jgi:hypothetical protein
MTVVLALILAQAVSVCAPAAPVELPGGATIVRPVGTVEPIPFLPLGPATGLPKSEALKRASVPAQTGSPVEEPPVAHCSRVPVHIV